jgi:predicted P-loop ATPase
MPKRLTMAQLTARLAGGPWAGVWRLNTFSHVVVARGAPLPLDAATPGGGLTEDDCAAVRTWLHARGAEANYVDIRLAIRAIAKASPVHPVREFLDGCPPSPGILDSVALAALGADPGEQPLANVFLRKFLLSAVRRVREPGCKVDTMLVLVGEQGTYKSTFFAELFSPWFCDQMPDLATRDGSHALEGNWCVEFGECHKLLRTDKEVVKDYLARAVDKYRQYGNADRLVRPRQNVFAGTTNQDAILRDETGDRRSWPIRVGRVDIAWVRANKTRLWGEASRLVAAGESHFLTPEEESTAVVIRDEYADEGPLHDLVADYLAGRAFVLSATEVYQAIMHTVPNRAQQIDVIATLRRLGCKLGLRDPGTGKRRKVYLVPPYLAGAPVKIRGNWPVSKPN